MPEREEQEGNEEMGTGEIQRLENPKVKSYLSVFT